MHSQKPKEPLSRDRQLMLVAAIWALVLIDAARQGVTLPESDLAVHWPAQPIEAILAFTLLAPPLLVAANRFLPLRGGWAEWPQRVIDRWFGQGAANSFWIRLRPLALASSAAFVLGGMGYVASGNAGSAPGSSMSILFLGFGVGFLIGALFDAYVFSKRKAT